MPCQGWTTVLKKSLCCWVGGAIDVSGSMLGSVSELESLHNGMQNAYLGDLSVVWGI